MDFLNEFSNFLFFFWKTLKREENISQTGLLNPFTDLKSILIVVQNVKINIVITHSAQLFGVDSNFQMKGTQTSNNKKEKKYELYNLLILSSF